MSALCEPPDSRTVSEDGPLRALYYANEPFHGHPTEVFAWMGVPESDEPVPGIVCVHGGGGKAFREWVEIWVERGYAAISMDLGGCGLDGERHPAAGPEQDHPAKFGVDHAWEEIWTYHAACVVVRAHSLLRVQDRVDPSRIGLTGISWGGYLACIAAGIDPRLRFAIPVYGCGHLQHNSTEEWIKTFDRMTPERRAWWHAHCDPSIYLPHVTCPTLWVTGTNDFAYPLDSLQRSYGQPRGEVTLCIRHEMAHGHVPGWSPSEIGRFVDHHLRGEPLLATVGTLSIEGGRLTAPLDSTVTLVAAEFLYTTDRGPWQMRKWHRSPADLTSRAVSATLPEAASVCYINVEDADGCIVNTPHLEFD